MQGYEDLEDFTVKDRIRSSIRGNSILIGAVGAVAIVGISDSPGHQRDVLVRDSRL